MEKFNLQTPVVFIIFNRPQFTQLVFNEIRKVRPSKLLVIADGPRLNQPDDIEKCTATRAVIEGVDWDCEVLTNYSDINLGCGKRISSGLHWVFDKVEEAIILEDDCLPHHTFFRFCQELLEKYRSDTRVMSISGNYFNSGCRDNQNSYYFSRHFHMWGWATWRRAWQQYDFDMKLWPEIRDGKWLFDIFGSIGVEVKNNDRKFTLLAGRSAIQSWYSKFEMTYNGIIDTWDYQFFFHSLLQNGLHIIPSANLVSNMGFNLEATHTRNINSEFANVPIATMQFPLKHPQCMLRDVRADEYIQWHLFYN